MCVPSLPRRLVALLMTLVVVVALAACAPVPAEEKEADDEGALAEPEVVGAEPPATVLPADFTYLNGVWTISAELTEIDKGTMAAAAERPAQRWECTVTDGTMTLTTDTRTYTGTIARELDDAWVFTATSELTDEDGYTWTSAVEIHGRRTGEGLLAGTMAESLDSAEGSHEYTAEWRVEGRKQ
jgi:hypothetical protein